MLKAKQAFTCLGCSKSYTRKSKLLEHFELPQVKNKGVLVKNKCFQSKERNYGTSEREVAFLKKQKSIASFQYQEKVAPSGLSNPSVQPSESLNETLPPRLLQLNEDPSNHLENTKNEFQASGAIGVAEEVLQSSEIMKQEMNIPPTDNFHIPVGDNADISTEKYDLLLKNQEKIIAMLEACSLQQQPSKIQLPPLQQQPGLPLN